MESNIWVGNNSECTSLSDLRRQFLFETHEKVPAADAQRKRSDLINLKIGAIVADF